MKDKKDKKAAKAVDATSGAKKPPKRVTFTLTVPGVIGLSTVLLLGLIWVFIFGVLVGRGYQPENAVPELARIMPAPAGEAVGDGMAEGNGSLAVPETAPEKGVLKAEELDFPTTLKGQRAPASVAMPKVAEGETAKAEAPAAKAPAAKPEAPKPAAAKEAKAEPAAPAPGVAQYRYVYQAASFRKQPMAEALAGKARSLGFTANLEQAESKGDTWHRVLIEFTASEQGARTRLEELASLGIRKPFRRSKTAVQ